MGANSLERRGRVNKYTPLALLELLKCAPCQAKPQLPRSRPNMNHSAHGGFRRVWSAQEGNACIHVTSLRSMCWPGSPCDFTPWSSGAGRAP